ncbi:PepSY domain-containing protein [Mycolicibacterium celeriflavum]|uniref:Uncharacterized protein n=1 Tax=Mycolicibacterium celeriflavum TaxID=1249101 RepID=A0A1X0BY69_MYCCF|nr:PepSY domain-containing protein [Mycolicibacterium celeriflavum]MCV7236875.1 PepSY domain-containing protein [Mycolicibacterium celeriflavum]ORA49487.1 metallopeptidase [Mycolicibacterium celeriflavum]BBY43878.1 hypothetical protein MCEL_21730 [Mycolicibacterium celeriflavum]
MVDGYFTSKYRRTAAPVLAAVLLVAVSGCAGGDDEDADSAGTTPAPAATSAAPAVTSSAPASAAPASTDIDALRRAGSTATAAVPDSTLISIETERDGRWEVQVVTADGTEHEMDVSSDGATVTMGPTAKGEDEADKAKHRDRVQAARVDYRAAADKILAEVPNGAITELNLDSNNGTTVWEADVIDDSQTKHEVTIDAGSGQVLQNTTGR